MTEPSASPAQSGSAAQRASAPPHSQPESRAVRLLGVYERKVAALADHPDTTEEELVEVLAQVEALTEQIKTREVTP